MSHQLHHIADPFEFARSGSEESGELDAVLLPRLEGVLRPDGGVSSVRYQVSGVVQDEKPFLRVHVDAHLMVTCQRCLAAMACDVEAEGKLLLVRPGEALPDEDLEEDDFDPVHATRNLVVVELVEDELLLALPLAPTHEKCKVPAAKDSGDAGSPFAVLKNLKIADGREK